MAISSVVLTVLYGQTRILFAMSRDGLVPRSLSTVDARTGSPRTNTIVVSLFVAALAAFIPLGKLADATSIGTLFAFALVNVAVLLLRRRQPDRPRTFRVPFAPVTPILGVVCCGYLMFSLDGATWVVFGAWMAVAHRETGSWTGAERTTERHLPESVRYWSELVGFRPTLELTAQTLSVDFFSVSLPIS